MQAYNPPPSLWRLVEQHVCLHEQEEIKCMLGLSLVEQSIDLHEEIDMLLDIWRDMRDEEEDLATTRRGLPEPPNIRERLIQEIVFFVDNVKEKAKKKGIDPDHLLKQHNVSVLEYAQDQSRPGSAIGHSSRSSDGRETPMMMMSPERLESASNLSEGIHAMDSQLNYLDFDNVCTNLRKTLEEEVERLLDDIDFLHCCLDNQADVRDCVTPRTLSREPTITELREERTNLEKEMLSTDAIGPIPPVQKSPFKTQHRVLPSTPPSPKPSSPISRSKPLKANHNLGFLKTRNTSVIVMGDFAGAGDIKSGKAKEKSTLDLYQKGEVVAKSSRSDGDLNLSTSSHVKNISLQNATTNMPLQSSPKSNSVPLPSPPTSTKPYAAANIRRRTSSPGRVRVVDVTQIVEPQIVKTCLTSASVQATSITTTAAIDEHLSSVVTTTSGMIPRPNSANRFRKLVQGFREDN